jgi:class 3 adenylate cyclase
VPRLDASDLRRAHGVTVEVRVGLNSGEVVVRTISSDLHMDYSAVGQTTHLAARMEQLASPGTTLLTADTLRLAEGYVEVRPLGAMPVKGLPAPVEAYEFTRAGSGARASPRWPRAGSRASWAGTRSWSSAPPRARQGP